MSFVVPLNVHSEYEISRSLIKTEKYIDFALKNKLKHVAIANNSTMSGCIEFYYSVIKNKLKPIIGVEFNICKEKSHIKRKRKFSKILLYAKNNVGFQNLIQLTTYANTKGKHKIPRIDLDILQKHSVGLICVTNELSKCNNLKTLSVEIKEYHSIFGNDLYIGLKDGEFHVNKDLNTNLITIAKKFNIKTVFANEIRYFEPEQQSTLETINLYNILAKDNDAEYLFDEFYFKKDKEVRTNFEYLSDEIFSECISNIDSIFQECNVDLDKLYNFNKLPQIDIPRNCTSQDYLEELVFNGVKEKYPRITDEVITRYMYELEIIKNKNLADYFLTVWDYINYAKENDIPYCIGRGTAPSSIVCYALDITNVDPVKHGLLFERFLNSKSDLIPDIDIDFAYPGIKELTNCINEKYQKKTANIISFGEFSPRVALKTVCFVDDIPRREYVQISKVIDNEKAVSVFCQDNEKLQSAVTTSKKMIGLKFDKSTHLAGKVISSVDLDKYIPLEYNKNNELITQYTREELEKLGFIKFDFIPNREVSFIHNILKDVPLNMSDIPIDDELTFELLKAGKTDNIYEMSDSEFIEYLVKLQPDTFRQLCTLISLYRKMPIETGLMNEYIARKNGKKFSIYSEFENVLNETYGLIVYEEQVTQLIQIILNCSLDNAEIIRRSIKNGNYDKNYLIDTTIKNGFNKNIVQDITNELLFYSKFAFMKSHAVGYSMQCYYAAYLKANYPEYFML